MIQKSPAIPKITNGRPLKHKEILARISQGEKFRQCGCNFVLGDPSYSA